MEFSLSLSGGGARGAAHVGVLKALEEEGLRPSALSGTSAGALVAALYAYGLSVAELEQWVYWLAGNGRSYIDADFLGMLKLIIQVIFKREMTLSGLIKGKKFERLISDIVGAVPIEDVPEKLVIPAVDLNSGKTIVFSNSKPQHEADEEHTYWEASGSLCRIVRASTSVPGLFEPVQWKGYCLVDGGIANNLPVDLLMATGEKNVLAVDVGARYEEPNDCSIIEILTHSFAVMGNTLKECTADGEQFLIKPLLPKAAGLLSFEQMPECMMLSYQYTKAAMPQIRAALS